MNRTRPVHHRRRNATVAALATTVALTACGGPAPATDNSLSVGVFFPGSVSDTGFMESGYLGYRRIEQALGGEVKLSYVEQVAADNYEQALVRFASQNELVVSLGGQTDAVLRKVVPQFPDVKFVEIGGPADAKPLPNLAYYDPQQAEAEYLSGAVSGAMSPSVGFVGGVELPAIVNAATAYGNGARSARRDVTVLTPQYVGDFNDPAKARQAAAAEVGAGAGVLGQIVNLGKQGMEQAVREAGSQMVGGPIPGDCTNSAYVGYVHTDIGKEIEYAVNAMQAGTWAATQVRFGLTSGNGGTDFVLCSTDTAARTALDNAKKALSSGVAPY